MGASENWSERRKKTDGMEGRGLGRGKNLQFVACPHYLKAWNRLYLFQIAREKSCEKKGKKQTKNGIFIFARGLKSLISKLVGFHFFLEG